MTTSIYLGSPLAAALAQRILRFPVTRIVLSLVFFMVPFLLIQSGATHFFEEKLFARLGQLFPIDVRLRPPDRFQVITGFRRVSALRFLQREKVLARLHTDLSDADAMLMTLASAIHSKNVGLESLSAIRAALEESGRLSPSARDMLEKALSSGDDLSPESVEEEVDADELAADVTVRLGQANQDLSLLADVFSELDETRREELLKQLRYSAELVAFLESKQ